MKISLTHKLFLAAILFVLVQFSAPHAHGQIIQEKQSTRIFDASGLDWELWCYRPDAWRMNFNFENFTGGWAEYRKIPMDVPGSVRKALLQADIISDWNMGLNNNSSEWIENRNWLITARIPDQWIPEDHKQVILHCDGLDHKGTVKVNGLEAGTFENAFIPHSFDITPFLKKSRNTLVFAFDCPPEDLDQIGYTSRIKDWKPRFYYGWDWIPRIVQIGIWDRVWISTSDKDLAAMDDIRISARADRLKDRGELTIQATLNRSALDGNVRVSLSQMDGKSIFEELVPASELLQQKEWTKLKVKRWWPNGSGEQVLYKLELTLLDKQGLPVQQIDRRIGFKNIQWLPCEGASADADPWICSVNNQPVFLQGINWTPIRPNFADLKKEDYSKRLNTYKELGVNTIRVWGGGFAEKKWLYELCDELGILIWQDFPLSSSGIDNYPPEGIEEIYGITQIAEHYLYRLQHHVSILLWCGGNELYKRGDTGPVTDSHIMIAAMKKTVNTLDPSRRFISGSPSGPSISAGRGNFGSGKNWETHGPWKLPFTESDRSMNAVRDFWSKNDALFISEAGVPGAMSADMINTYRDGYDPLPASLENPIWRNVNWWVDWDDYLYDHDGKATSSLEEYVTWSQNRQAEGLSIAVKSFKDRFPGCGGFLIWMGHDSFPCMVNTSILDYEGNPKPAAIELSKIWKNNP